MQCYASRTGTKRNLDALREAGWRLMVSRTGAWRTEGFRYALDNGAWSDYTTGRDFDDERFKALVDQLGWQADWVVAPDIVGGGLRSLRLSLVWLADLLVRARMVLVPVQDDMVPEDLVSVVVPKHVGIFLGGSTPWKLANMQRWGEWCAERDIYYHVGRVNTQRRMRLACLAGADSVDGSSASRYAVTLPMLDEAAQDADMWEQPKTRSWNQWRPPINRGEQIAWAKIIEPEIAREAPRLSKWKPFVQPEGP